MGLGPAPVEGGAEGESLKHRNWFGWIVAAVALPGTVLAEGTDQLNTYQALQSVTEIYARVADPSTEVICWEGVDTLTILDPVGFPVGTSLNSGECTGSLASISAGDFRVVLGDDQQALTRWDISVCDAANATGCITDPSLQKTGRVHSNRWSFSTGDYSQARATDGSVYALAPGGLADQYAVIELKLDGLSGFAYELLANRTGVSGENAGRSVREEDPDTGEPNSVNGEFPLFLNPPDASVWSVSPATPTVSDFAYNGGSGGNACTVVEPGVNVGEFAFTSNVEATYHLVCDLDDGAGGGPDGVFDITAPHDVLVVGSTSIGSNTVSWNGRNNAGDPVPAGSYNCQVRINVGEFHYVARDVETSYEGLRLFEWTPSGPRNPLSMHWNDTLIVPDPMTDDIAMDNGEVPPARSPAAGVDSGDYANPANPYTLTDTSGNARAWGNYVASGRGEATFLDTFAWVRSTASTNIAVDTVEAGADTDSDGLSDGTESCVLGSDPNEADTDGDGVSDAAETSSGANQDTDGDGTPDVLDTDDDGDGVLTIYEGANPDSDLDPSTGATLNTDGDGLPDYLDPDDDGDGVLTLYEGADPDSDGNPTTGSTQNTDSASGDAIPDYLDVDDDGDGVLTALEGADPDSDGNPLTGTTQDTDVNMVADYLDDDDDGDGIPTLEEASAGDSDDDSIANYLDLDDDNDGVNSAFEFPQGDTDSDSVPDYLDEDDDGDGVPTALEGPNPDNDGDPTTGDTQDTDGDTTADYLDPDDDGDLLLTFYEGSTLDSDEDTVPNYLDPDDDGDSVDTRFEDVDPDSDGNPATGDTQDSDGDSTPDYLDVDDDDDGVATEFEGANPDGDGDPSTGETQDTDEDETPDYLDEDDDSDGLRTVDEGANPDSDLDPATGDTRDTDQDDEPDYLDDDDDGDGIPTGTEIDDANGLGSSDPDEDGLVNWYDTDSDGDGVPDATEYAGDGDINNDGIPDYLDASVAAGDADGDTVPDYLECPDGLESCPDTDGDGTPDYQDPDDDGDGVPTSEEATPKGQDTDFDGVPDYLDDDDDGDGIPTAQELPDADGDGNIDDAQDTDGDGVPDYLDSDDDNDGISTADESTDEDGDGVPDYLQSPALGFTIEGGPGCSVGSSSGFGRAQLAWSLLLLCVGWVLWRRRNQLMGGESHLAKHR